MKMEQVWKEFLRGGSSGRPGYCLERNQSFARSALKTAEGARPRVHGNGFIQLDLTDRLRLHIWGHPEIPRQKVRSPIHDHVFSFTSYILVGRVVNVNYRLIEKSGGDYRIHTPTVRQGEDTILRPTDQEVSIGMASAEVAEVGTSRPHYMMSAFRFHETLPDGPSATIIEKYDVTQAQGAKQLPRVLVPNGQEPDNEFNRYDAPEELLWRIIREVLK